MTPIDGGRKTKLTGNVIITADKPNALGGQKVLLYKTDEFGSIRNSANGIEVSESASPTTISIASMLARETMNHQPLILHGSSEFQEAVLSAAVQDELEITFADPLLQTECNHRKEKLENARRKFVDGGTVVTRRTKSITSPAHAQTIESVAKNGFCVPTLSELAVVHPESEAADVLLSDDERGEWNTSIGRKHSRKEVAAFFMLTIFPNGRKETRRNFSGRRTNPRAREIAATWKSSLRCRMS